MSFTFMKLVMYSCFLAVLWKLGLTVHEQEWWFLVALFIFMDIYSAIRGGYDLQKHLAEKDKKDSSRK